MMKAGSGFTSVELLIIVVVLGILAAIVIPQFSEASADAKLSRLLGDIQMMRSQIELYKLQHDDAIPGAGTASFTEAMTGRTAINGALGTDYGPYIQKIPTNSFNKKSTLELEAGATKLGGGNNGWHFNTTTALFCADTDEHKSY